MSFQNQQTLKGTLQQLKEIVTGLQGEDHESARLVSQMEALVAEIEDKTRRNGRDPGKDTALAIKPVTNPVQVTI